MFPEMWSLGLASSREQPHISSRQAKVHISGNFCGNFCDAQAQSPRTGSLFYKYDIHTRAVIYRNSASHQTGAPPPQIATRRFTTHSFRYRPPVRLACPIETLNHVTFKESKRKHHPTNQSSKFKRKFPTLRVRALYTGTVQ